MAIASESKHYPLASPVYAGGMASVYMGERVLSSGVTAWMFTGLGVAAVLTALVVQAITVRRTFAGDRGGERSLLLLLLVGCSALLAYLLTSDLILLVFGTSLARHIPILHTALASAWLPLCLIASLPLLFVELSYVSMRRAPVFERARLNTALLSGLGVAFALVFAFATGYVGRITDVRFDVAYFRTAKAGESTQKIIAALDRPLTITTFFPPTNDVAAEVDSYFGGLAKLSSHLTLSRLDHALDPAKGRELGVTGNGVIVFSRGTLRRQIGLPLTMERARAELRKLDAQVNNTLLNITRPARRVYFTQGHGERVFKAVESTDRRSTLGRFHQTLLDQGYDVVELSIAHGLGADVPDDAVAVAVAGPTQAFLPEEAAALVRYVQQRGGSVLLLLDPENGQTHATLLEPLGLAFDATLLANDLAHWRRSGQASDRYNVATASFGAHVSVATLAKLGMQSPLVFMGVGSLRQHGPVQPAPEVIIEADGNTWADADGNFEAGANEARQPFALAAVASFNPKGISKQGRAFVLADADALADIAIQNHGNQMLLGDAMRWLSGDEAVAGDVSTEEDVAIVHSRQKDVAWFYVTSFVPPIFILVAGFLFTRRRRTQHARDEHVPATLGVVPPSAAKESA